MIQIADTIVPIFAVILLGTAIRSLGFFPPDLTAPLNRLVYYLAIPAMIFSKVAGASFQDHFHAGLLIATILSVPLLFLIAAGICLIRSLPSTESGTFIQSSFHGNLGYIGLAVVYYSLGDEGLTGASILAGFLMLVQNLFAVIGLQLFSKHGRSLFFAVKKMMYNPIILSSLAGILFSVMRIPLPVSAWRGLEILSGMALPLALLVIGASLSFDLIKSHLRLSLWAGFLKLILLPSIGYLLYRSLGLAATDFLPGLILLAAPTATVTYVMASEMNGSTLLATSAVSLNTLLSAFTFIFWLSIAIRGG